MLVNSRLLDDSAAPLFSTRNVVVYLVCVVLGGAASVGYAYVNHSMPSNAREWFGLLLSFSPLTGLTLAVGVPMFRASLAQWLTARPSVWRTLAVPALICAAWSASEIIIGRTWDPYAFCIMLFSYGACIGAARDIAGKSQLTWTDALIWMWAFIPLDLRWVYGGGFWGTSGQPTPPLAYDWFATAITLVMMVAYGCLRKLPGVGVRLVPTLKDIAIGVGCLLAISALVLPLGLALGFLKWNPQFEFSRWFANFVEIALTVALTEELFFRAVLFNGFNQKLERPWLALFLSSLCFGLMHWPREHSTSARSEYVLEAIVAGMVYGIAYWKSGNNILAPVITHALTDSLWDALFHRS